MKDGRATSLPSAPQAPREAAGGTPARYASELLCVWCGPAAIAFFTVGFLAGGFLPPVSPASNAAEVVSYWSDGLDLRRFGIICFGVGGILFIPFAVAIATQLRRIEGPGSPLAATQVAASAVTAVLVIVYTMMLMSMLFRLERAPEITQALNDLAWIPFVGVFAPNMLQAITLGIGVLADKHPVPLLPRWVAWYSLWYAFASLTGCLTGFFRTGPFAWNGLLAFYVAAVVFFLWYVVVFVALRRAVLAAPVAGMR